MVLDNVKVGSRVDSADIASMVTTDMISGRVLVEVTDEFIRSVGCRCDLEIAHGALTAVFRRAKLCERGEGLLASSSESVELGSARCLGHQLVGLWLPKTLSAASIPHENGLTTSRLAHA